MYIHKHLERAVLFFGSLVLVSVATAFIFPPVTQAAPINPFVSFGGYIGTPVFQPLNLACPEYSVIANIDPTSANTIFGVFIPPELPLPTYEFDNLFVPGTAVLGAYVPVPNVLCAAPFPVYPLFPNGLYYMVGTAGL